MFELLAISHEDLTLEKIQAIPIKETHTNLLSWLDLGAKPNMRIATNADPNVLRKIQASLAFHGIQTLINERPDDSASRRAASSSSNFTQPPTNDYEAVEREEARASGSGLHAFRQMVAEQDQRRSTASHVLATTAAGFRLWHAIVLIVIAIVGAIFAMASRGA